MVCEQIRPPRAPPRPVARPIYYRYNTAGTGPTPAFAYPRQQTAGNRPFTFYQPRGGTLGGYPGRAPAMFSPTRMGPAATPAQVQAAGITTTAGAGQRRVLSPQEVQAYEERSLSRAIRLSMLEY